MAARNILVAVLLAVLLASSALYTVPLQAQMGAACAQELARADSEFKAFAGEVKATSLDAVSTDVVGAKLSDVRTALAGKPDEVALDKLKDLKKTVFDYAEDLMTMKGTMDVLVSCLNSGPPGCLLDIVKKQNEAFARWMQRLTDLGKNDAVNRVNEAGRLLAGYATKAATMATGNMTRGINACQTEVEKAIQAEKDAVATQDAPPDPAAGSRTPKKSGGAGGTIVKAVVVAGGVVAGGVALGKAAQKIADSTAGSGSGSGGSSGGGSSTTTISSAQITCTSNSGEGRRCNGSIIATIGPSVSAGVGLNALTIPSNIVGHATPGSSGGGQTLTFNFVNASTTTACPPTQTSVIFTKATDPTNSFTSGTRTFQITCQ